MADYQNIRGLRVKYLSTDPSTTTAGEVWYNSTSGTLKASVLGTAAWSSGGNMVAGRRNAVTFGLQTAAIFAGGHTPGGIFLNSETYDGTTWTEGPNLSATTDYGAAAGISTAGIAFGGTMPVGGANNDTQSYNGSAWSAISADTDVKTLVSSNDTTAGYLNGKLVAGSNVTFTENSDGSNETLTIAATDPTALAIALG